MRVVAHTAVTRAETVLLRVAVPDCVVSHGDVCYVTCTLCEYKKEVSVCVVCFPRSTNPITTQHTESSPTPLSCTRTARIHADTHARARVYACVRARALTHIHRPHPPTPPISLSRHTYLEQRKWRRRASCPGGGGGGGKKTGPGDTASWGTRGLVDPPKQFEVDLYS